MPKFQIDSEKIVGFVAEQQEKEVNTVKVVQKISAGLTSDVPLFHFLMEQIDSIFIKKVPFPSVCIFRLLIVLHEDNKTDIFINDFKEIAGVIVNKPVETGSPVFKSDIEDLTKIEFPDIEIKQSDAVVYTTRIGWKYGLFFDFTRNLNIDEFRNDIGRITKKLMFEDLLLSAKLASFEISEKKDVGALVFTEGKTDWKHLKKALEVLGIPLKIEFFQDEKDRGDQELLRMCEYFSLVDQHVNKKFIFIFDRDNPGIINKLSKKTEEGANFQVWGNNVFSFYLPYPPHREKYKNISIEFYYTDEEVHTKDSETGRQLLFSNEIVKQVQINPTTKKTTTECVKLDKPRNNNEEYEKKIFDEDVEIIKDRQGDLIAHSKSVFAENVLKGKKGFDNFDMKQFSEIFKIIQTILEFERKT